MSELAEHLRLAQAGLALRMVMAAHDLSREQRMKVLAALYAHATIAGQRQDEWPEALMQSLERVRGYIVAECRRQQAVLAETPARGNA